MFSYGPFITMVLSQCNLHINISLVVELESHKKLVDEITTKD